MKCQQIFTREGKEYLAREANVSHVSPVIPQVAFCLVSDSLRKGSNLIFRRAYREETEERQTAGTAGEQPKKHMRAYLGKDSCDNR